MPGIFVPWVYLLAGKKYPLKKVFEAKKESEKEGRGGKVLLQC